MFRSWHKAHEVIDSCAGFILLLPWSVTLKTNKRIYSWGTWGVESSLLRHFHDVTYHHRVSRGCSGSRRIIAVGAS